MRKIIHIDMDSFYASVEIREKPELADKPIAVGGSSDRSVLTTCNYLAREYGCRSAMPTHKARRLCPELIVLPVRMELYSEVSQTIRKIFYSYTPLVEPLSLDEAYLDVTAHTRYAWDIAKEIRFCILEQTGLTASAGIAPNKLLAKIASDWRKPNGQFAVPPEKVEIFIKQLPVKKLWGIGPKNAGKFTDRNIDTCGQMQALSATDLAQMFGKFGADLYQQCRGNDERPVVPDCLRKSVSTEHTFDENLTTLEQCEQHIERVFEKLLRDSQRSSANRSVVKLFVKLKFSDFKQTTRECLGNEPDLSVYRKLLAEAFARSSKSIRLIGIGVRFSPISKKPVDRQLVLPFDDTSQK